MKNVLTSFLMALALAGLLASCHSSDTMFETLPSSRTHIDFTNHLEKHKLLSILYYLYYYNGGGVGIGDINNDGLPDIYFTANHKGGNKLYLNKGNFQFEDITDKAGVAGTADWCTGVTMADINGDGLLDIYVCAVSHRYGLNGHNLLYINNGNGTFTESAAKYGLDFAGFSTQAAFFDYDHDGDLDCYLLNQSHHPHANIVDTSHRHTIDSLSGDRLYRNDLNTTGKFTEVSQQAGIYQSNLGYGLGLAVADFNNDGWEDIYVGNDFHENDYYYINNHNGTFTECGAQHFGHYSRFSMGNDAADYDNDGQTDLITVDMLPPDEKTLKTYGSDENLDIYKVKLEINGYQDQQSKNCLQHNNGDGSSFSELGLMSGVSATDWSWCPLFADYDNDGNKDLFITSGIVKRPVDLDYVDFVSDLKMKGMDRTDKYDDEAIEAMPDGSSHPFFFRNNGKRAFEDRSKEWGTGKMKGFYNGAAYADLDNDGRLDLVVNCIDAPALVLRNKAAAKDFLGVSFSGEGYNRFGVGAKAYVFQKGRMQYQQLMPTRGFESSSDLVLHFGLDTLKTIDSVLIVWPSQKFQVIRRPAANQVLKVKETDASGSFDHAAFFPAPPAMLSPVPSSEEVSWRHRENDFVDFNIQYLIPHELSTHSPRIAVGDVNRDGRPDFYICGAKHQPGALMIQQPDGSFKSSDREAFLRNTGDDQVGAVFVDVNNDSFPDLYVAYGGNEDDDDDLNLMDALYMNDGKGHFTKSERKMPPLLNNKSCVLAADIDHDGDQDIFIGSSANARSYGYPRDSYMLINDGHGNFQLADSNLINLKKLGIVTSAVFVDLNKDGWPDLAVTGEWMPLKIFINHQGRFTEADVPNSTGLWQTLYATDVNGDGYTDLLAGNWGHNSKLYAGKNGPLKLYVKDFDKNGSIEQVMAYTIDGKEYPFLAKDELERRMPVLKKAYLHYGEVAGKTVQYIFYDLFKDYLELKAETLSSSCFFNDGKGQFTRADLPDALQEAPLMAFTSWQQGGKPVFLGAGNFYGVIPYEGRYDALMPTLFSYDAGSGRFRKDQLLKNTRGEVRDLQWIQTVKNGELLMMGRNNDSLLFWKPQSLK